MNDYVEWLKSYFAKEHELPEGVEDQNYFELGLIDSFGVIELIEEMESEFNIRFGEEQFQDRRFSTIRGLAEIIEELKRG